MTLTQSLSASIRSLTAGLVSLWRWRHDLQFPRFTPFGSLRWQAALRVMGQTPAADIGGAGEYTEMILKETKRADLPVQQSSAGNRPATMRQSTRCDPNAFRCPAIVA
jgi:hypothetical protein